MCSGSWPDFNSWLDNTWGAGEEFWSSYGVFWFGNATNLVFGRTSPIT